MKYYAMINGEQKGPFELSELAEAGVRPSTYIWCKGMSGWEKAQDDPEVCRLFRNRLYDIMHPVDPSLNLSREELDKYRVQPDDKNSVKRTRFDVFLKETGETLPTIEEIDEREDKNEAPVNMVAYAWLVTILCFFPTGIAAIVFAYKSRHQWKEGNKILAHGYCRSAKMWTGISFFLGLIFYAFFFAYLI